ncbi:hypothetical protein CDL12_24173 [Handroanthus impetiginosus]|uniref:Centromere protein C/Mif2/cnp3 n=1 Tax=Handroanthus impetiginosus TaxID=429701 RepID=A0A2G9GDD4_9LAMI|nr:hypothetical protein CDL12_24173 [Handroanthus impetiginosus]
MDAGEELLNSNRASFARNTGVTDTIAAKDEDRPQERRPGLGLARKRAPFSLKSTVSQPSVSLEPTLNIDHLQDPDEFFDAYEKMENAKKEIQKQLGGSIDNLNVYKPSNTARRRRPGILGKSYNYRHRYSSAPSENEDKSISPQETVDQEIPSAPEEESQENLVQQDPTPDADLKEVEAVSMKKIENEVSDILEELLSFNNEDLEGDGALNLLQERLNIKPLVMENLCMTELPDVGRTSISTVAESLKRPHKSSMVIDSVLKNLNRKSPMEHELVTNPVKPVSSPTPPRSPFASITLLKKKSLQRTPQRDPFSPLHSKDKPLEQADAVKVLDMSSELESRVEVDNTEPAISNVDAQKEMGNADRLPEQLADENASTRSTNAEQLADENASIQSTNAEQLADENASIRSTNADNMLSVESDNNIEKTMDVDENESNPSVLEEARDDVSSRQQAGLEQQPEEHQARQRRGKRVAGEKRIRQAHPMRKSLAESGTSFETGVRRSKRIKMRPLEYWKGERFLYGRVDNSLKLIGVKYFSPGKDTNNLKVKPYISSAECKELLSLAARH